MKEKIKDIIEWSKDYIMLYVICIVILCSFFLFAYYNKYSTTEYREIVGTIESKEYIHNISYVPKSHITSNGEPYTTIEEEDVYHYNISIVAEDCDCTIRFTEDNYSVFKNFAEGQTVRVQVAMHYWKGEWQNNTYSIIVK